MRTLFLSLVAVAGLGYFSAPALLQEKGGDDRTGPYDVVPNWPQPLAFAKPGYIWGSTGGIFAETPNRIFIANRGELKLPPTVPPGFTGFWGSFNEQATTPTPEWNGQPVRSAQEEDAELDTGGQMHWILRRQTDFHLVR